MTDNTPPDVEQAAGTAYRGRFAPSPTGPLHFGSLVAAVGSFLEARSHQGEWLLRIEDVDAPRCSMKDAEGILRTLEVFGFEWDGPVIWQSHRREAYTAALAHLRETGQVFHCACTRKELADSMQIGPLAVDGGTIYPGTCRAGLPPGRPGRAWRLRVDDARIGFIDALQGTIESSLARDVGDFIVLRADGCFAYQLAVVVDDDAAGITHVVRGADLLHSTPRQIFLQRCLGFRTPHYLHLPVMTNAQGEKLSKQTLAPAIDATAPVPALLMALRALGQPVPDQLAAGSLREVWQWAMANWRLDLVPRTGGHLV